jgi:DNA-binding NarL/FixJ family response regulator
MTSGPGGRYSANRPTLLLGEDHPGVAQALRRLLGEDFDVVAVVPDGEGLIELAHQLQPTVIVADVGLEGLDGISATSEIRRRFPAVTIVVITASDDLSFRASALAAGASGFLSKREAGSLVRTIEGLLTVQHPRAADD